MKLYIDLPENYTKRIHELFSKKGYSDINAFILAAVDNQIRLENGSNTDQPPHPSVLPAESEPKRFPESESRQAQEPLAYTEKAFWIHEEYKKFKTVPMPSNEQLFGNREDVVSVTGQLLGLINRIFPVKLALRVLAYSLITRKGNVHINVFRDDAANFARGFGQHYKRIFLNKEKPDFLIGLPLGDEKEKSLNRFRNHFVIAQRDNGSLDGALAKLKFVNVNEEGLLNLTQAGLNFVLRTNPILDNFESPLEKLSEESLSDFERTFYLEHVKGQVKGEYDATLWVIKTIDRGFYKRELLGQQMKTQYPQWSPAVVTTQQMGLISRCVELGLIKKEKQGKNAIYLLTEQGKSILPKRDD